MCLVWATMLVFGGIEAFGGGRVEDVGGKRIVHLALYDLPDASRSDAGTAAELAVQRAFLERAPGWLEERARARGESIPEGRTTEVRLHRFSGIQVEGVESTLMAIAGNVAPDVMYVNFRQSETYIGQGFLQPLDRAEDGWYSSLDEEERRRRVHPAIEPVIRRRGPDGEEHVWALPGGAPLGRVVLWRRDLFAAAGLEGPRADWTWDDFLGACRAVADPGKGVYAVGLSRGKHESYLWLPFLWGAGGEALEWDAEAGRWRAAFDSEAGAEALDFYVRLTTEAWTDGEGRRRRGYAIKDTGESSLKWRRGQLGMMFAYVDQNLFANLNADLTGMAPMPVGPVRRGTEINSRMMGIFAGQTNAWVRDAAWEYIRFQYSKEAEAIRVRQLVEGGLGRFLSPERLEANGYGELAADFPAEWREASAIALAEAKPEPYGKNANVLYDIMTEPIRRAEELALAGRLPEESEARRAALRGLLTEARKRADAEMLGEVEPRELAKRRAAAGALLAVIAGGALLALRQMARWFWKGKGRRGEAGSPKGWAAWAPWLLLLPAMATIAVWAYVPLLRGSAMAFQDYRIFGRSAFTGLDNFANLLWDAGWWRALWTSARYAAWTMALTFLPPVGLAVLLQEVPRGKVAFRMIYYLPAAVTGLVVILMWKGFYEPSEAGLVNRVVMGIPAWGWAAIGAAGAGVAWHLAGRLRRHGCAKLAWVAAAAGVALAWGPLGMAWEAWRGAAEGAGLWAHAWAQLAEPVRWLDDSRTALFSCVLPMLWAGMGPGCLIYLAALKGVPDELYEAADMDGATFSDKVLFVAIPTLKPLIVIQSVGAFIAAWQAEANILAMTAGGADTEVAGLHIFYKAFLFLRFGPATAAAWMLATLLIGFTLYQLKVLSRVEFRTAK